ncbi:MAG: hypothetical protein M5U01_09640 [Ardenticatenaceae bacterium]|nr:hypothetical protein [Ardenticatenaceae bacterium]
MNENPDGEPVICKAHGCTNPARTAGYCGTHYHRVWKHGDPTIVQRRGRKKIRDGAVCSVDGCDQPVEARGLCSKHYARWRRWGDPEYVHAIGRPRTAPPTAPLPSRQRHASCTVDGCDRPHKARGYCDTHYARWRTHGDPLREPPPPQASCSVAGCDAPHTARGYCRRHYDQWRRGHPLT